MQIIKNRKVVNTPWQAESGGCDPDTPGGRIVPLERWLQWRDSNACEGTGQFPGLLLQPDDEVGVLADEIEKFPVIAINVSELADGRIYTLARILREQYRYKGELRAIGAMPDNLAIMERCGFDAFVLCPGVSAESALGFFSEIVPVYQFWRQ